MRLLTLLNEIHYRETLGKGFESFLKKYSALVRKKEISQYSTFVSFTDYRSTDMDKTAAMKVDHMDMSGIYCYFLPYVLKYPADIWYASNAKYIQVIQGTWKKALYLKDNNDWSSLTNILYKMGFSDSSTLLQKAKKVYKHTGKKAPIMSFMSVVQADLSATPTIEQSWGVKKEVYPMRSAVEQTKLFLKAGYDAIIDEGTGAINEREPEQIIFLTRQSFKVIEVIPINLGKKEGAGISANRSGATEEHIYRKFAAAIAAKMQDKLTDKALTTNMGGWNVFFTVKGRRIELALSRPNSYFNRPLGDKPHKYDKKGTREKMGVRVYGEFGKIEFGDTDEMATAETCAAYFEELLKNQTNKDTNWAPQNQAGFLKQQKRENYIKAVKQEMEKPWRAESRIEKYNELRAARGLPPFSIDEYFQGALQFKNIFGEPMAEYN